MPSPSLKITAGKLLLVLPLAAAAALAHRSDALPWHMVGSTCGLYALALLLSELAARYPYLSGQATIRGRTLDLEALGKSILPPVAVVVLSLAVMAPLFLGQMPLSHDHPVHLYKAWHFWEEMLLQGRLRGWSSFWFFGYPAEELYPIGSDLWVALFRALTLGLLSWEATYGLAFVGVFAFAAYAIYSFGRRTMGTVAGLVAAVLWVLDMGDYREGGWSYTVDWAVWVQILAMGFLLLALGALIQLWERGRAWDYARAGLLLAAALLSHQMNVMLLGLALPLLIVSRWLAESRPMGRQVWRAAGACLLGACLAGFYLIPMLMRSGWTTNIGDLWRTFDATVRGLMDGTVFANNWPLVVALGLVGAVVGMLRRHAVAIFLTLLAALLLVVCTSTAFEEFSLVALTKAFAKIQWQRLIIPAKACFYLLAGLAVMTLMAREATGRLAGCSAPDAPPPAEPWRRVLLLALVLAFVSPFVRPALNDVRGRYVRTIGGLTLKQSVHYWEDYKQFLAWSLEQRKQSKEFYRISYELDRHNHMMMGAPAYNQTPYYKVGYTPAKLFKHITETTEPELYKALSVRYVVALGSLNRADITEEKRFGALTVYRFNDYQPRRYTLTGPGKVEVLEFGEESIKLRLSGTGAESKLKVHVANYPRWRARLNGEVLPIGEAPAFGTSDPMLMEVPVKDGELEFDYVMRGADWLGTLATLAALVVLTLLILGGRGHALPRDLLSRLERPARLGERYAGWATLLALLVAVGWMAHRWDRGVVAEVEAGSLVRLLPSAKVTLAGRPCDTYKKTAWGMGWFCSDKGWNYVGNTAVKFGGGYVPCIWAHPLDEGPLTVRFPDVLMGKHLDCNHGIADGGVDGFPGGATVTMKIKLDGETLATEARNNVKGWVGFRVDTSAHAGKRGDLTFSITTPQAGGRHYCFDAKVVR